MKIFAIRDEQDNRKKDLAYLFYYERDDRFCIELPDDADPWETPLILSSFIRRGERTVDDQWSRVWVQQRIVPTDRQNLGQILRDNGLDSYREYELLCLAEGRCAQDSFYLVPIRSSELPDSFAERFGRRVWDVVPLSGQTLLVFFQNGEVKKCDLKKGIRDNRMLERLARYMSLFRAVTVQTGGLGVSWGENLSLSHQELYRIGRRIPLQAEDFREFVKAHVVNTAETAELLGCSKQNVEDLVRRGKLHPVKESSKSKLFLKSEVLARTWV